MSNYYLYINWSFETSSNNTPAKQPSDEVAEKEGRAIVEEVKKGNGTPVTTPEAKKLVVQELLQKVWS